MKIITKEDCAGIAAGNIEVISDSGENLTASVCSIDIRIRPDSLIMADMSIWLKEFKLEGVAGCFSICHPETGEQKQIKSIQFTDGTIWETK